MARIRSIHPGLFTDEAFMSASAHARLLIIGIWGEAWDDGVFEWKPLTLKAKLFPVDNVDVVALLAELVELRFVQAFEAGGRRFGAVRNFQKYQRPKKPNSSHVLPLELRTYVGTGAHGSELVPNQPETPSPKAPQMEDGGGRVEKEKEDKSPAQHLTPAAEGCAAPSLEMRLKEAAGLVGSDAPALCNTTPIAGLIADGFDLDGAILPILRAKAAAGKRGSSWSYYVAAIREAGKRPPARAAPAQPVPTVWVKRDSPQGLAWSEHELAKGHRLKFFEYDGDGHSARRMPSEWPPQSTEGHIRPQQAA